MAGWHIYILCNSSLPKDIVLAYVNYISPKYNILELISELHQALWFCKVGYSIDIPDLMLSKQ